jgi:hypothetical protein
MRWESTKQGKLGLSDRGSRRLSLLVSERYIDVGMKLRTVNLPPNLTMTAYGVTLMRNLALPVVVPVGFLLHHLGSVVVSVTKMTTKFVVSKPS